LGISFDGGDDIDRLNLNGGASSYALTAGSIAPLAKPALKYYHSETIALTSGSYALNGTVSPDLILSGGATLTGAGTILGKVTISGSTISPGSSPGLIATGRLSLIASDYLVDLNGLASNQHDLLNVTGTVNLLGASLSGTSGYGSLPGDEIPIIRNDGSDAVTGTFLQGSKVTIGGKEFAIDYAYDADGDGKDNDIALIRSGAELGPDPLNPLKTALYVSGTTGNDDIRFVSVTGSSRVKILINGQDLGTFQSSGLLIAAGQAGNDIIRVNVPSRASMLFGNNGDDTLLTGNNDAVLVGGNGNDLLDGGNGKDLMVGGAGADNLRGGKGEDLLIAGSTSYDANNAANRTALAHIAANGPTGSYPLNSVTVFDDGQIDQLQGGNGKDTFFANVSGSGVKDVLDLANNETSTDL
jgi:Ca2+-binding RTX toxin-like protein